MFCCLTTGLKPSSPGFSLASFWRRHRLETRTHISPFKLPFIGCPQIFGFILQSFHPSKSEVFAHVNMPSKFQHGTGETLLTIVWIILNVNMFKLAMDSLSTKSRLRKPIPSPFLKRDISWNDASILPSRISSATTFRIVSWIVLEFNRHNKNVDAVYEQGRKILD